MKKIENLKIPDKSQNAYYLNNPKQFDLLFDLVSNNLKSYTIKLRSRQYFKTLIWIYVQTQVLDEIEATLKTRIYWIFNNIHEYPKCANPNCTTKLCEVQNISDGYNGGYCSIHCAESDPIRRIHKQEKFEKEHGKGITCPQKLLKVKQKISESLLNRSQEEKERTNELLRQSWLNKSKEQIDHIVNQRKQTSLNRYGVEVPSQTTDARNHLSHVIASNEIQQKIIASKKRNGTTNSSKLEDQSYDLLCAHFSKDDVVRQYRSEKYPFNCDFYIKSIDTYIECNFSWTHGGHWFDESSEEDQKTLQKWKDKGTDFYQVAIDVWTRRDMNKLKAANENGLNYLVFWKLDEVETWLKSLKKDESNES